jgi:hypothetical protein
VLRREDQTPGDGLDDRGVKGIQGEGVSDEIEKKVESESRQNAEDLFPEDSAG